MSFPLHDMLQTLHVTLRKIDADPEPTSALLALREILECRIAECESTERLTATLGSAARKTRR